jgi:hypothetical protein
MLTFESYIIDAGLHTARRAVRRTFNSPSARQKTNITPIDKSSFFISSFILLVVHFFLVLVPAELIL